MATAQEKRQLFNSGLAIGNVVQDNSGIKYTLQTWLGRGSYGEVFRCVRTDADQLDESVAVVKAQQDQMACTREGAFMQYVDLPLRLTHPKEAKHLKSSDEQEEEEKRHIVKFLDCFRHGNLYCLLMESMPTDLWKLLCNRPKRMLSSLEVSNVSRQLLSALAWLKKKHLIHADIKPDNVLVDASQTIWNVKLADFGWAFKREDCKSFVGQEIQPSIFRAPEIYVGAPFDEAIDMWSLGILSGMMMYGIGCELFSPYSPLNTLQVWARLCGDIPTKVLEAGKHTEKYYLKTGVDEYTLQLEPATFRIRARAIQSGPWHPTTVTDMEFEEFFFWCMAVDPEKRLTPKEGLQLAFNNRPL